MNLVDSVEEMSQTKKPRDYQAGVRNKHGKEIRIWSKED